MRKRTRGSEPSQYPEEEKANAIPPVAASEKGTAQTWSMLKLIRVVGRGLWGNIGRRYDAAGELQIQLANLNVLEEVYHRG